MFVCVLGFLQDALSRPSISQEMSVHVRMKQNAAVLRSRGLHKRLMERQESSDSGNMINDDKSR